MKISIIIEKPPETVRNIQRTMAELKVSDSPSNLNTMDQAERRIGDRLRRVHQHSSQSKQANYDKPSNADKTKDKLNPKSITKLYMNNKLGRIKNTPLETIFEHEEDENVNRVEGTFPNNLLIFSSRKVKRCTTFHDINSKLTKTLKKKRNKRIQKVFKGKQKRFKRISIESFRKHLNIDDLVDVSKTEEILNV